MRLDTPVFILKGNLDGKEVYFVGVSVDKDWWSENLSEAHPFFIKEDIEFIRRRVHSIRGGRVKNTEFVESDEFRGNEQVPDPWFAPVAS